MSRPPLEILGRYKILRVIGRGAMGVVYEAIDPDIDRVVAIKTINLTLSPEEMVKYEARFKQEIKAAGRLNHPNIVTIYDVGKVENFAYMAMEFIHGCELKDVLKSGTSLSVDVALDIIAQAAEGLAFAHSREIIHRDVKPANIMLLENDEGVVAKITDFGIARMPASALKTMTGMVMGSPRYMSPEQVVGGKLSARSDIFSLGVVMYEALTGTAPFESDSISSIMYQTVHAVEKPPSNLNPLLDPELDAIVAMALAKLPEDRFETMKAFSRKLRDVIRSRGGRTHYTLAQLRDAAGLNSLTPVDAAPTAKVPPAAAPAAAVPVKPSTAPTTKAPDFERTLVLSPQAAASMLPIDMTATAEPKPAPETPPAPEAEPFHMQTLVMPRASVLEPSPSPVSASANETEPEHMRTLVMSRAPAVAVASAEDALERTGWPVTGVSQFDSTAATLRLAEATAQTDELSAFISASKQLPAFKEAEQLRTQKIATQSFVKQEASAPAPATANQQAAITLTLDALPMSARKMPTAPLFLLGGLGATVLVLLIALIATF
jgi:eukaryotic-like serine/threonine-protein kinase